MFIHGIRSSIAGAGYDSYISTYRDQSNKMVKKHHKLINIEKIRRYAASNNKNSLKLASSSILKQIQSLRLLAVRGRLLLPVAVSSLISAARVGSF